ncbi:hypothetical protein M9H77_24947 [Catharanthus roseus]|uniref:Uncharacterized protein n=1 Tax=Catharanthus roseus TaxID=4058 RepID=A0ACC0A5S5_CATRO|nr:hypothetical protein M9H77_24947 [Catharanthus roseus]
MDRRSLGHMGQFSRGLITPKKNACPVHIDFGRREDTCNAMRGKDFVDKEQKSLKCGESFVFLAKRNKKSCRKPIKWCVVTKKDHIQQPCHTKIITKASSKRQLSLSLSLCSNGFSTWVSLLHPRYPQQVLNQFINIEEASLDGIMPFWNISPV